MAGTKLMEVWTTAGLPLPHHNNSSSSTGSSVGVGWAGITEVLRSAVPRFEVPFPAKANQQGQGQGQGTPTRSRVLGYQVVARGDRDYHLVDTQSVSVPDKRTANSAKSAKYGSKGRSATQKGRGLAVKRPGQLDGLKAKMAALLPAVGWNPFPGDYVVTPYPSLAGRVPVSACVSEKKTSPAVKAQPGTGTGGKSLSVVVNRSRSAGYVAGVLAKAEVMLDSRAYVHWYERYGCDAGMLEEAFEVCRGVVADYQTMTADSAV